jgi:hypothetical protein
VITRTSLSRGSAGPLSSFFGAASCFAFFARSFSLVFEMKAIVAPSGDHSGEPAPLGRSVRARASPPPLGIR